MTTWMTDIRLAIALQDRELLEQAIPKVSDVAILDFLQGCRTGDIPPNSERLIESLRLQGRLDCADHVKLVAYFVWLGDSLPQYMQDPTLEDRLDYLEDAIECCDDAIKICERYNDMPCKLYFLSLVGGICGLAGRGEGADEIYACVVQGYRDLARREPDLYRPYLISTLVLYAQSLAKIGETETALKASIEIFEFASKGYNNEPEKYEQFYLESILLFAEMLEHNAQHKEAERIYIAFFGFLLNKTWLSINRKALLSGFMRFCYLLVNRGELNIAERILQIVDKIMQNNDGIDFNERLDFLCLALEIYRRMKSFSEADIVFKKALALINMRRLSPSSVRRLIGLYKSRADMIWDDDDLDSLNQLLEESKKLHTIINDGKTYNVFAIQTLVELEFVMGKLARRLGDFKEAIQYMTSALKNIERVEQGQERQREIAAIISIELGGCYSDVGEQQLAHGFFEGGLQIFRDLCMQDNGYEANAVAVLIFWARHLTERLRKVVCLFSKQSLPSNEKENFRLLRARLSEAKALCQENRLWNEIAEIYFLEAFIHFMEHGELDTRTFKTSLDYFEKDALGIRDKQFLYLDKRKFEFAYKTLIAEIAIGISNGNSTNTERIISLLESRRQVEVLSKIGEDQGDFFDATESWKNIYTDLNNKTGRITQVFEESNCVLMWVEVIFDKMLFVIQKPGSIDLALSLSVDLLNNFRRLQRGIASGEQDNIFELGKAIWEDLPDKVKAYLIDPSLDALMISPCEASAHFSWGCIPIPVGSQCVEGGSYLGLTKSITKIQGISELAKVLNRTPMPSKSVFIVGNPLHQGLSALEAASVCVDDLERLFKHHGFSLIPFTNSLTEEDATFDHVMRGLKSEFGVWIQMGHGGSGEGDEPYFIALSGEDKLYPKHLAGLQWEHHPIIHLDCCEVGRTLARGGGKFDDHATAMLHAGASCVLCCSHEISDDYAAEFTTFLYQNLISSGRKITMSKALLMTQKEMASKYDYNPNAWNILELRGNPWITL